MESTLLRMLIAQQLAVDPRLYLLAQLLESSLLCLKLDFELRYVLFAIDSSLEQLHCCEKEIDPLAKLQFFSKNLISVL